jgi:hypothetical protein
MKKMLFLLIALNIFSGTINAQKADLNGIWKLTKSIQYGDQIRTYISYLTFKDTGIIEVSGRL